MSNTAGRFTVRLRYNSCTRQKAAPVGRTTLKADHWQSETSIHGHLDLIGGRNSMITWAEISAGIQGAWRLARRDPRGLEYFDASIQGYWRSFWAAVLLAPAFVALDMASQVFGTEPGARQILVQAISYVIDWTAFPLIMILVADNLDRWHQYMRYIVAYNWSSVVQMAILLPAAFVALLAPSHGSFMILQALTIVLLVYRAYVAHISLGVGLPTAGGIVLLDVLLAQLIKVIGDRMMVG